MTGKKLIKALGMIINSGLSVFGDRIGVYEEKGVYYLTNGYVLVRLHEDIPELQHTIAPVIISVFGTENYLRKNSQAEKIKEPIPSQKEMRYLIKLAAERQTTETLIWVLSDGTTINAHYLCDLLNAFPRLVIYKHDNSRRTNPVVFSKNTTHHEIDGAILPIIRCRGDKKDYIKLNDYWQ